MRLMVKDTGATWGLLVDWLGQAVHIIAAKGPRYMPKEIIYPCVKAGHYVLWAHPAAAPGFVGEKRV